MHDPNAPRRFYTDTGVAPDDRGWRITLDTRPVRTPAGVALSVASKALARAIAGEWDAQDEVLDIASMHLTRLANVAIDRTPERRDALVEEVARYCETDLVCHRATKPEALRDRQEAAWRPLRDWIGPALGIVLIPVDGIIAAPQPAPSLDAARAHAAGLDNFRLTGLVHGCGLLSSAVMALALEQGAIEADDAFARAHLDEAYQAEQWGHDDEADAALQRRRAEVGALGKWFALA